MRRFAIIACAAAMAGCTQPTKTEVKPPASPEYFKVDASTAAKLRGTVKFAGKRLPSKVISMEAEEGCQKLHQTPVREETVLTGKNGGLANVFVYLKTGLEGRNFEPPKETVMMDQRGCMFRPRVVAARAGQTIVVKNSDPVSHNIHPRPRNNREWNQQQSPGAQDLTRRFARSEVMIPVRCNVHAWMKSYIGVMDHPYFAVTAEGGTFEWDAVPPGDYVVAAWHEVLGEQTVTVKLQPGGSQIVSLIFR